MRSHSRLPHSSRAVHLFAAIAAALSPVSMAIAEAMQFDIAADQAPVALKEFIRQTGLQLIFEFDAVRDHTTRAIKGEYEAADALREMLVGTGLVFQFVNERTVTISRKGGNASSATGTTSAVVGSGQASRMIRSALLQAESEKSAATNVAEQSGDVRGRGVLEEILVTAEKRSESIQDLPMAISAYSGESLIDRGVEGVESLQQVAPSLTVGHWVGGLANVTMRGVGNEVGGVQGEPGVAITQDGVAYANPFLLNLDFFDVERVEVLRGPQGTISGRNATAGAINVHSKRPTEDFEGGVKVTLGNYSRLGTEGYLSGPLAGDRLLGRLAVRSERADGWVTNTFLGDELGMRDKIQARASLLAQLGDSVEARLILEGLKDQSNTVIVDHGRIRPDTPSLAELYGYSAFDWDKRTTQQNLPGILDLEKYQATLNLAWDLSSSARLTATTGYVDLSFEGTRDTDGTLAPTTEWGYPDGRPLQDEVSQLSQEITLTADLNDSIDVIFGALYLDSDWLQATVFGLPLIGVPRGSLDSRSEGSVRSWAGYTQWRFRLTESLRFAAGVRYTHDTKDIANRDITAGGPPRFANGEASWDAWTPRVTLEFVPDEDVTIYASMSRGFKSGGFYSAPPIMRDFGPEYVWNYEAGMKAGWMNQRLRTSFAGFLMDYEDLQQTLLGLDPSTPFSSVINAKSATVRGVELDIEALATDRLKIAIAGTWLDATYDELFSHDPLYPELGTLGPRGVNVRDLSGNRLVRAPEWKLSVSGEYAAPLRSNLQGILRVAYAWQDTMYFQIFNRNSTSQGDYGLVNVSASIEAMDGSWQLAAFVNNVTDKYYISRQEESNLAPVRFTSATPGLPRMYGVSLARRF